MNMLRMEINQEENRTKKASEIFSPVFYLRRNLIVTRNMNTRGGWASTGKAQLQVATLSSTTIIKRGFGISPAAKFLY